ncbi:MAG: endolytic transglycosylase MltG [Gammaproteobacteria bacterium]|nr:endolytic transglycosylase MltG [Gammaproteobacteria bacterium]
MQLLQRKDLIAKLLGGFALFLSLLGGGMWYSVNSYSSDALELSESTVMFVIPAGSGLISVANDLKKQGIIESARKLRWLARIQGKSREVKAGEYQLEVGMTIGGMLDMFVAGKVKQYALTLVEGWTFKQMMSEISAHPKIRQTLSGLSPEQIMSQVGFTGEHPEGRFLPDTYHFPVGTMDVDFLKRAHKAMEEVLSQAWEQRQLGLPYQSAYDALTMASIVEKETSVETERAAIAGVFVRRLQKRMRLQTDPTVIYGMGDSYEGNIRRSDLKRDTPYNTYTRSGLPPTPIAMPGRDAIVAALNPEEGDALYFVAKGDGSHFFSSTIEEHNKAVVRYQIRNRKRDYRSTPTEN